MKGGVLRNRTNSLVPSCLTGAKARAQLQSVCQPALRQSLLPPLLLPWQPFQPEEPQGPRPLSAPVPVSLCACMCEVLLFPRDVMWGKARSWPDPQGVILLAQPIR